MPSATLLGSLCAAVFIASISLSTATVTVNFQKSEVSLLEGRSTKICLNAKGVSERPFVITIVSKFISATAGDDFVDVEQDISFGAVNGQSTECITLTTKDDSVVEDNEMFSLLITSKNADIEAGPPATITIVDNDLLTIGFEKPVFTSHEGDGKLNVHVVMNGESEVPVTVRFTTYNVHAMANEDYVPMRDVPITFQPGEKSQDIQVTILDDNVPEKDEGFTASLAASDKRVKIALDVAVLLIWDDE